MEQQKLFATTKEEEISELRSRLKVLDAENFPSNRMFEIWEGEFIVEQFWIKIDEFRETTEADLYRYLDLKYDIQYKDGPLSDQAGGYHLVTITMQERPGSWGSTYTDYLVYTKHAVDCERYFDKIIKQIPKD